MKPYYADSSVTLYHGDALDVLRSLDADSIDAVVTDPPYGLEFMGREWDSFRPSSARIRTRVDGRTNPAEGKSTTTTPEAYVAGLPFQRWCQAWATECRRVLKPGAHLLAFGGARTVHRLTCAIEDAGFEIRDGIDWIYASGFPKSLDVSKAIDKAAGAEREVVGMVPPSVGGGRSTARSADGWARPWMDADDDRERTRRITAPATEDARRWSGWGTALKPAREPIVVARKPLAGTVAANVLKYGTGALNIDGCRVAGEPLVTFDRVAGDRPRDQYRTGTGENRRLVDRGRWPTNVVLTHAPDCRPVGTRKVRGNNQRATDSAGQWTGDSLSGSVDGSLNGRRSSGYAGPDGYETVPAWACVPGCPVAELDRQSGDVKAGGDKHGVSASGRRGGIMGATVPREQHVDSYGDSGGASRFFPVFRYEPKADSAERPRVNGVAHPTVKPLALMRWLVRLVTPPGGVVLDPFAGSGTTGEACVIEGFPVVLVEREAVYLPLIVSRLSKPIQPVLDLGVAS